MPIWNASIILCTSIKKCICIHNLQLWVLCVHTSFFLLATMISIEVDFLVRLFTKLCCTFYTSFVPIIVILLILHTRVSLLVVLWMCHYESCVGVHHILSSWFYLFGRNTLTFRTLINNCSIWIIFWTKTHVTCTGPAPKYKYSYYFISFLNFWCR